MPKQLTVFYSWQSDTPSNLNRNFIERALEKALKRLHSDAALQLAERPKLDKDTKDVPGSPPIADTILRKIEECAAFVADVTFVGKSMEGMTNSSGKPRLFPNPNVLIEHGYALKCRGHGGLVGIMNTAYGEPSAETLPFDLRHLRFPITYHLSSVSDTDNANELERLTTDLVARLRPILANQPPASTSIAKFERYKSTTDPAVYWTDHRDLLQERTFGGEPESFLVPYEAKAYLRLSPTNVVPMIETELDAADLARQGNLRPLGRVSGYSADRNIFGAIVYEGPIDRKLYHFTQLFLNREIWGVDSSCVRVDSRQKVTEGGGPSGLG